MEVAASYTCMVDGTVKGTFTKGLQDMNKRDDSIRGSFRNLIMVAIYFHKGLAKDPLCEQTMSIRSYLHGGTR